MNVLTLSPSNQANIKSVAIVVVLLAAATAGGFLLDQQSALTSQAMLYVLAVVMAAYVLRWLASVVCAVSAVMLLNFVFVPPRWTLEVDSQAHLIALISMLLVALFINHLVATRRQEAESARRSEQRARQLQALATQLLDVSDPQAVVALGQQALAQAFAGPCLVALAQSDGHAVAPAGAASQIQEGMDCCMREVAVLGPGTGRWPGLSAWYLPLGDKARMTGAVCIQNVLAADKPGREHAQALCALMAQALWRLGVTASMQAVQLEAQRQQVQSTFLAAISHDLRTPLATLVGAASSLQTQHDKLDAAQQRQLLGSIVSEATYLSNLTENTLQLVQLSQQGQALPTPVRDWEAMEEIVGAVLARMRPQDPQHRIRSQVALGLPLVRVNAVLVAQLLANLLDNALKYSEGDITVVVEARPATDAGAAPGASCVCLAVKDRGTAIPEAQYASIFEPYARSDQSGQRGAGLGLALGRAIANVHGGQLTVSRRTGGGNQFCLRLPLEPQPPQLELP